MLRGPASAEYEGMSVMTETDGEYIRYTIHGKEQLDQFFKPRLLVTLIFKCLNEAEGVKFPCPIPLCPEKMNDIGVLRMQVM